MTPTGIQLGADAYAGYEGNADEFSAFRNSDTPKQKNAEKGTETECLTAVLITAAGLSSRFSRIHPLKKEFIVFQGKSLLAWSVEAFLQSGNIDHIIITYPQGALKETQASLDCLEITVPITFICGGETRQNSVRNGLEALRESAPGIVLIHDGARPGISPDIIQKVRAKAIEFGGALPVIDLVDSLKTMDSSGRIIQHIERSHYVGAQTPQGFRYREILAAHQAAEKTGKRYLDDTEIFSDFGGTVVGIQGSRNNIKITYKEDLETWKQRMLLK